MEQLVLKLFSWFFAPFYYFVYAIINDEAIERNALNNNIFHHTLDLQSDKHFSIHNLLFWIFQQRVKINGSHKICLFYGMPLKIGMIYSIVYSTEIKAAQKICSI